jgi:hypothetical protein
LAFNSKFKPKLAPNPKFPQQSEKNHQVMAQKKQKQSEDWTKRWEELTSLFQEVNQEIELANRNGKIAPKGCWIVRYRVRGKGGTYWYYKWQSPEPIFVTKDDKKLVINI